MHLTRAGLSLGALLLLAACEVPTGAPNWDTRWDVPSKSTTISVSTLLPTGVSVTPDQAAFLVSVPASSITRVLGNDCASCQSGDGTVMIKPAFTSLGNASSSLPANVLSAAPTKDTLVVTINNGYNFDPLRPSATARGTLVITATSGGATVGVDTVQGVTTAMPAGQVLVRRLPLTGAVSGSTGIQVSTNLTSPPSDTAIFMDAKRTVNFVASVGNFYVSSANVNVSNQPITAVAQSLDLTSIDSSVTKRVQGGTFALIVTNPFTVGGNLTVKFVNKSGATITKPMTLSAGSNGATSAIDFSTSELQSMLGQQVDFSITGTVSQVGSSVAVSPAQSVAIATRLSVNLTVGSSK